MNIHEQKHGAVMVVKPEGPLVEADVAQFRQRLEEVRRHSMGRIVVDLSDTPFADSRGLEALVEVSEGMADSGQALRLCGVNETVREVMELTELAPLFEFYDSVSGGVRSFL